MKKCKKCGNEKKLEEFPKLKSSKDGHNTQCRECKNKASREWVKKNPEKRKASLAKYDKKAYWERNRDHEIERNKQWKKDNPEKVLEIAREWRKNNPDKVKAMKQRDYQKNKEKCDARNKEWRRKNPDKLKEIAERSRQKESNKERKREYTRKRYEENPDKENKRIKEWKKNNEVYLSKQREYQLKRRIKDFKKYNAVDKLNNKIRKGEIVRPTKCSRCQAEGIIEGHHYDYDKPLDVIWLCRKCHAEEHKEINKKQLS